MKQTIRVVCIHRIVESDDYHVTTRHEWLWGLLRHTRSWRGRGCTWHDTWTGEAADEEQSSVIGTAWAFHVLSQEGAHA